MTIRVYVPATLEQLAAWHDAGELPVVDDAVLAPDDSEEGEYAALMDAADVSAALLDGAPGRRVVLVAELADEAAAERPIPLKRLVAVHADLADRPSHADPDEDLGWFATQEIPDLLGRR